MHHDDATSGPELPLALLLLRASRWIDGRLLDALAADGWARLTPAQSVVFAHLDPTGTPPSELARRLGTTRQAAQDMVSGLAGLGLLVVVDDPDRARGRLVRLTAQGRALVEAAEAGLARIETELGHDRTQALRTALAALGLPLHEPL